jgi:hypothetical protein
METHRMLQKSNSEYLQLLNSNGENAGLCSKGTDSYFVKCKPNQNYIIKL